MAKRIREQQSPSRAASSDDTRFLTLSEAAVVLNEDTSYVVQLLDTGKIAATGKGQQRRTRQDVLLAYKQERDAIRARALDELSVLSQDAGLDEIDFATYRTNLA